MRINKKTAGGCLRCLASIKV